MLEGNHEMAGLRARIDAQAATIRIQAEELLRVREGPWHPTFRQLAAMHILAALTRGVVDILLTQKIEQEVEMVGWISTAWRLADQFLAAENPVNFGPTPNRKDP